MSGETMRDRFAMAALTGLLANPHLCHAAWVQQVEAAYQIADLATAARGGAQPSGDAVKQQMLEALRCLRRNYSLFVGPDDDIANAVKAQADAAIAAAEKEQQS